MFDVSIQAGVVDLEQALLVVIGRERGGFSVFLDAPFSSCVQLWVFPPPANKLSSFNAAAIEASRQFPSVG